MVTDGNVMVTDGNMMVTDGNTIFGSSCTFNVTRLYTIKLYLFEVASKIVVTKSKLYTCKVAVVTQN